MDLRVSLLFLPVVLRGRPLFTCLVRRSAFAFAALPRVCAVLFYRGMIHFRCASHRGIFADD
jgi:hypothetical protein